MIPTNNNNSSSSSSSSSNIPNGTIIKNRWRIQDKLGSGSFGDIYAAVDIHTERQLALKVERASAKRTILRLEIIALRHLQPCSRVVRYVHCGQTRMNDGELKYLVMERLGDNLAHLRKTYGEGSSSKPKFSMNTTARLGIHMIDCLEGVHRLGYVHRDIKPSNFVINMSSQLQYQVHPQQQYQQISQEKDSGMKYNSGKTRQATTQTVSVYIIDFGLARKYLLQTGTVRPARSAAGFRGTVRYASINSHEQKELGPHDDMWCVFYSLVEFATGSLPWMRMRDKLQVLEVKKQFNNEQLVKHLPSEFLLFMNHLKTLKYGQLPDYDHLRELLWTICKTNGYEWNDRYDWQLQDRSFAQNNMNNKDKNTTVGDTGHLDSVSPLRAGITTTSVSNHNQISRSMVSTLPSSSRSGQLNSGDVKFYSIIQTQGGASVSPYSPISEDLRNKNKKIGVSSSQQQQHSKTQRKEESNSAVAVENPKCHCCLM